MRACFLFCAAFVHEHSGNQEYMWAHRNIFERNLGINCGADVALAEVRAAVPPSPLQLLHKEASSHPCFALQILRDNIVVATRVDESFVWGLVEHIESAATLRPTLLLPLLRCMKV